VRHVFRDPIRHSDIKLPLGTAADVTTHHLGNVRLTIARILRANPNHFGRPLGVVAFMRHRLLAELASELTAYMTTHRSGIRAMTGTKTISPASRLRCPGRSIPPSLRHPPRLVNRRAAAAEAAHWATVVAAAGSDRKG